MDFIPRFSLSHHSAPYRHICVYCLFVGRNYPTSTRSTWISSRGLVSPTIHPPIVIYFHIAVHSVFLVCCFLDSHPRFDHSYCQFNLTRSPHSIHLLSLTFICVFSILPPNVVSFLHSFSFRCRVHLTPVPPFVQCSVIPSCRPGLGLISAPPCLLSHSSRTACHLH